MSTPHCPEHWPYHQWFRLARRSLPVAAEERASQPHRRAWVWVRPLSDSRYHVWYFEAERDRYEEVRATWDYDRPGMLFNQQRLDIVGEAELKRALNQWLDDLTKLGDPGIGTYPI